MSSASDLISWIDERCMVLVSGKSALPNAAEAIAGRPIDGSWWGDPQGALIFRLLNEIEDEAPQYLDVALVEGKRTLVSPAGIPYVLAVASDAERRLRVEDTLKEPARRLLDALAVGRTVRSDDPEHSGKAGRTARTALEAGLLGRSTSVHTTSGHHVSLLELFDGQASEAGRRAGGLRELVASALRSAVVAERREVEKWFRFVEPDLARRVAAIEQLEAKEIRADGSLWLTLEGSS